MAPDCRREGNLLARYYTPHLRILGLDFLWCWVFKHSLTSEIVTNLMLAYIFKRLLIQKTIWNLFELSVLASQQCQTKLSWAGVVEGTCWCSYDDWCPYLVTTYRSEMQLCLTGENYVCSRQSVNTYACFSLEFLRCISQPPHSPAIASCVIPKPKTDPMLNALIFRVKQ